MSFLNHHKKIKYLKIPQFSFTGYIKTVGSECFKSTSIDCSGFNSLVISHRAPSNTTLNIYQSNKHFTTFNDGASDNFSTEYELHRNILMTANTNYNKIISLSSKFILIRFDYSGSIGDYVDLDIGLSNDFQPLSIRDELIEYKDNVNLSRNTTNFEVDVADENIQGMEKFQLDCKGNLTSGDTLLWGTGLNTLPYLNPTNASFTINIVSSSNNDKDGSIGASQMKLSGLGQYGVKKFETINLNGTTTVSTNDWKAINKAEIVNVGQTTGLHINVGDITIKPLISGVEQNAISLIVAEDGISHNPLFDVPYNKILYITKISINSFCEDEGELTLNKYKYNDNKWVKHKLKSFHLHSQQQMTFECMYIFNGNTSPTSENGSERLTIQRKSTATPIGFNEVNVSLFGFLKDKSF